MGARAVNAMLGLWLFLSAFLWDHTSGQFHNAWIVGALVVTAALAGLSGARWGRILNPAFGGWLIISTLLSTGVGSLTFLNHMVVGVAVAFFAFIPSLHDIKTRRDAPV